VDLAEEGWWSGDFHVHRLPGDAKTLLAAEDLNLGLFITIWNARNFWKGKEIPEKPVPRAGRSPDGDDRQGQAPRL
jgi:hypothetical protein